MHISSYFVCMINNDRLRESVGKKNKKFYRQKHAKEKID